jgi:long-chain fatty acid transport protein
VRRLALLFILVAVGALADDGRYQDYPIGSRAMVLGGAFTAIADDPSGLYYNPAGVVDARRYNVSVSASLYGIERESRGAIRIDTSSFTIATLNVIPGEAGFIKGFGPLDERGTAWAFGFDLSVPSFRSSGTDSSEIVSGLQRRIHSRLLDRTFVVAAGGGYRVDAKWSVGAALHYTLRLFEQTEDGLVSGTGADPSVGAYHSAASFQNGNLVPVLGVKYRPDDGWRVGLSLGLPGIHLHSSGKVNVQDVVADPTAPPGSRTTVRIYDEADRIRSRTPVPLAIRAGGALVERRGWTLSADVSFHAGTSYDRLSLPDPAVVSRLRMQDHVERKPVLNVSLGGEYLWSPEWSVALGFFTDHSGAKSLDADAAGTLREGSSRLPNLNLYGGTVTLGSIGNHSIGRFGVSMAYGGGEDAIPEDQLGLQSTRYQRATVHQLFLYFFLASTFRY